MTLQQQNEARRIERAAEELYQKRMAKTLHGKVSRLTKQIDVMKERLASEKRKRLAVMRVVENILDNEGITDEGRFALMRELHNG